MRLNWLELFTLVGARKGFCIARHSDWKKVEKGGLGGYVCCLNCLLNEINILR